MYSPRYWGWKFFPVGVHKDLFKTKLPNKTGPQQILPLWHFAFPDHIWELIQVCVYLNTAGVRLGPFLEYEFDCQFKDIKLTQRNTTRRAWCPSQRMCNSARKREVEMPPVRAHFIFPASGSSGWPVTSDEMWDVWKPSPVPICFNLALLC